MKSRKVLIIEDDQWFAEALALVLKKHHYKTKISPHIIAAIKDVDDFLPDLMVMDLLLAGSTAFNLMNELQSHADLAKIPIVVCTNLAESLSLEDLRPYGVVDLIDKSTMKPEDIIKALNGILDSGKI